MKNISNLTEEEIQTLLEGYQNSQKAHFRNRCHSILLSSEGYKVSEIAAFYKVRTRTIYTWFNRWESNGILGLILQKGRGVKAKLDQLSPEEFEQVTEAIKSDPQSLKNICQSLSETLGFKVTKYMLKRILKKKLKYTWRRFRKCIKSLQFPKEYEAKLQELKQLLLLENQGFIKVYFADESGFSLTPNIPYGWQPKNQPIRIKTEKSKRLNTFGLLTRKNELDAYTFWGSATAPMIIAFIDDFAQKMTQRTAIVIDNATVHHSDEFHDKIEEWKEQDIHIFYLPRYSPNLNIIETLWRKIKYEWLKPKDYLNLKTLEAAIDNILIKFGTDFLINFEDKKVSII